MATSLEKSKKLNEVSKPLHLSTNPEILVKIAPLVSELLGLESRPLQLQLQSFDDKDCCFSLVKMLFVIYCTIVCLFVFSFFYQKW